PDEHLLADPRRDVAKASTRRAIVGERAPGPEAGSDRAAADARRVGRRVLTSSLDAASRRGVDAEGRVIDAARRRRAVADRRGVAAGRQRDGAITAAGIEATAPRSLAICIAAPGGEHDSDERA